jgi:phosphoglycerate dehydrogenase-like enzyme
MADTDKINVTLAVDFSDEILADLREVSPRLNIERHFPDVPNDVIANTEILFTGRYFPEPEQAPMLRWIQLFTAGMNHTFKHRIVQAEDIMVTSTSGIHATSMSNYALMMMLSFNFKMRMAYDLQSKAEWLPQAMQTFASVDMSEQTVGIVGYGSIGRELARLCSTMGMTVLASKRDVKKTADVDGYIEPRTGDPTGEIPDRIYPAEAIMSMAKDCDYLVVIVPMTPETKHMINDDVFDAMKDTAILINIARGSVVDEPALITALSSGKIGGAALDVFEQEPLPSTSPLWNLDNVIITPHISGFTKSYHQKAAKVFKENLKLYLDNRPLLNQLNRSKGY